MQNKTTEFRFIESQIYILPVHILFINHYKNVLTKIAVRCRYTSVGRFKVDS